MSKFYRILLLFCVGIAAINVSAKKNVTVTINDSKMAYIIPLQGQYLSEKWVDNKVELSLNDGTNIQVNANTGYRINDITVNGESILTKPDLSYMIPASDFADGDIIAIEATETPHTVLVVKGKDGEFSVTSYNYMQFTPTDGVVALDITGQSYGTVTINATADYMLSKVRHDGQDLLLSPAGYFPVMINNLKEGDNVYEIECVTRASLRTSVFSVEVIGDESLVEVLRNGYTTPVAYSEYEAIPFNPETELPITIKHTNYSKDFYSVTLNGEEVQGTNTYRLMDVKSGDKIVVETDYPDVDVPISFQFSDGTSENVLKGIFISDVLHSREEIMVEGYTVKMGSSVALSLNTKDFNIRDVICNGQPVSEYYAWVADDPQGYSFYIAVDPLPPYRVVIEGNPEEFQVISLETKAPYELTGEISTIEVLRSAINIAFEAKEGYVISGIYDAEDKEYKRSFPVTEDLHLYVYTDPRDRDRTFVIYFDPTADFSRLGMSIAYDDAFARQDYTCQPGYNLIKYSNEDFPFYIDSYPIAAYTYLNDVAVNSYYGEFKELNKEMPDNSVMKLFVSKPSFYSVTFDVAEDAAVKGTRDIVTPIVDFSEPLSVLTGSELRLEAADTNGIAVKVDGEELEADENELYVFTVNADTKVEVTKGNKSGIGETFGAELSDVYNLQGICVLRQADKAQINALPAGIYIVAGKKVAVK